MFNNQVKKMNCTEVIRKLSSYQDGELAAEVRTGVEEHLSGCEECRRELNELVKIATDVSTVGDIAPSANFDAGVMSAVNGYREKKRSGKFVFIYSFVFALFFTFGFFIDPFSPVSIPEAEIRPELSSILLEGQKFTSEDNQNSVIIKLAGGVNEKRDN
ncbi:MAG: zf-HC2 domain-containing protein [Acidobacteriota bacterium]